MKQINKENIFAYIAALCLYVNIPPYIVWSNKYDVLFAILFAIICFSYSAIKGCKGSIRFGLIFLFVYFVYSVRLDNNIVGFIRNMCITSMFFVKREFVLKILNNFRTILAIFLGLGLISYFIVKFTSISLPYTIIEPLNSLKDYNYIQYPFCVEGQLFSDFNYRFFAQFDEPGVVGTICGILLFMDNYNLRKRINIIFLLSGVMTFSLFFYVLTLIYIFMHASIKYKILIITLLIIVGIVLYSNEVVYELVFKRFEFENGKWIGDNRAVYEFDQFYETFRFSFEYFVGMDDTGILRLNQGGSTYKQIIVVHGALFFIMYITAFLIVAKKYFNNQYILYIQYGIILIGTLYQRPMIANYAYVFLLYSSIFYISVNSNCPKIK